MRSFFILLIVHNPVVDADLRNANILIDS